MLDIILVDPKSVQPTVFIGCIGYEHRSIERLRNRDDELSGTDIYLFDYRSRGIHSYDENLSVVSGLDCVRRSDFSHLLNDLQKALPIEGQVNLEIDVTSLDRKKISAMLEFLFLNFDKFAQVLITYYPQSFVLPKATLDHVKDFGPISAAFLGEASLSREHLTLIAGAGYEFGRIVGAIDVLEPERIYCFSPVGTDKRFEEQIQKNNLDFSFLEQPELLQSYNLLKPEKLYFELRRVVEFEARERNVLLLPLGPKIFAAISILIALIWHPAIMVWRHSTVASDEPNSLLDAKASGSLVELAFEFIER
ncbi:hypothetical protein [Pseudovibrio sp. Alg231-02]|uniref:hypothetical protein n=1 Tax=Pseudovibrio sp. Alg231-02 TaxID=1922223 RepID=UPI000D554094|nr:hypothetical protein [Pseudovibrio sp. Alg231-02]